jgi:DNA-directed RNA polymerase specialized sigma24 family protein
MTSKTRAIHYVDNKKFLEAITEFRNNTLEAFAAGDEKPRVPEYLGECIIKIATHLAYKANFINYSFRDEMVSDAIENCLTYIGNFDPAKSKNPFAYFTQISYFAFIRRIQKEKRVQQTKNRYIKSLDLSDILTQEHDGGEHGSALISYLKKQVDQADRELSEPKVEANPALKRRPKYLSKKVVEPVNSEILPLDEEDTFEA